MSNDDLNHKEIVDEILAALEAYPECQLLLLSLIKAEIEMNKNPESVMNKLRFAACVYALDCYLIEYPHATEPIAKVMRAKGWDFFEGMTVPAGAWQ